MAVEKYSFEVLFYVVFILIGQFASILVTGPFSAYMIRQPTRFLFSAHLHFYIKMNTDVRDMNVHVRFVIKNFK